MAIIFQTDRLVVRPFTGADAEHFFALNGNEEVVRYIRPVASREESDAFLQRVIADATAQPLYGRWAVEEKASGGYVGSFALIPVEGTGHMQLGYALLPPHWGKGYASELTRAGLAYVFTCTPLKVIYGYTEKPNLASQKVLLKCGFALLGEQLQGDKEMVAFCLEHSHYKAPHGV